MSSKLRIAIVKLTSCSGCLVQFLNLEDELPELLKFVDFAYFLEVDGEPRSGPYDATFIEGSVTTEDEIKVIKKFRNESKVVIALGACSTTGGIQALRNWSNIEEFKKYVYPRPEWIETLNESRPIADFIKVDYELGGCPVNKELLLYFIKQLLGGKRPTMPTESVCNECKRKGIQCVIISKGIPCLGPVTRAGCGALCPSYGRGCYGCQGPARGINPLALAKRFEEMGLSKEDIILIFKGITSWSKEFREVIKRYERRD